MSGVDGQQSASAAPPTTASSSGTPTSPPSFTSSPLPRRVTILTAFIIPILLAYAFHSFTQDSVPSPDNGTSKPLTVLAPIPISSVIRQNLKLAQQSWEHGVLMHGLLELQNPELGVFAGPGYGVHLTNPFPGSVLEAFPDGKLPMCSGRTQGRYDEWTNVKALRYAAGKIETRRPGRGLGKYWLYREDLDGAAADAASLGWGALLLERAAAYDPRNPVAEGSARNVYGEAAEEMVDYLVTGKENGGNVRFVLDGEQHLLREVGETTGRRWAISHRIDTEQLWGDFVFMVPPFLAAFAVARQEEKWLWESVEQILAYRDVLRVEGGELHGAWRHIISQPRELGKGVCCHDEGLWLTSNAWALAGMVRVLGVLDRWEMKTTGRSEHVIAAARVRREEYKAQLIEAIREMLKALQDVWEQEPERALLPNYMYGSTIFHQEGEGQFPDPAGTALMASSIYRLAQLHRLSDMEMLPWADEMYNGVAGHVQADGVLTPVASVTGVPSSEPANSTSEAQSFVILMYAARRDCEQVGACVQHHQGGGWLHRLISQR